MKRSQQCRLTLTTKLFRLTTEVHAGWCPPGTSNPVDLPLVDRSVRFRHTSATSLLLPVARWPAVESSKLFAPPRRSSGEPAFWLARLHLSIVTKALNASHPNTRNETGGRSQNRRSARLSLTPYPCSSGLGPSLGFRPSTWLVFRNRFAGLEERLDGYRKVLAQPIVHSEEVGFREAVARNLHMAIWGNQEERGDVC